MLTADAPRSQWGILKDAGRMRSRLYAWWRRHTELDNLDRGELERIAGDLGMTGAELKDLAARGPHAADQLEKRMRLLGITGADVERVGYGLMRDLERTCAHCREKGRCDKDLAANPGSPAWAGYCPNAVTLTAVKNAMHHTPGL
jgi:hypothetical protein